jgi:hypothetical protein
MPLYRKRSPELRFQFVPSQKQSTLGGLPAVEALAQQFDLWNEVRRLPGLDPRTRTSHGYSPELLVAQITPVTSLRPPKAESPMQVTGRPWAVSGMLTSPPGPL